MAYVLLMRDISGRGYKALHKFKVEGERDAFVMQRLMDEECEADYIEECLDALARGQMIEEGATQYEYL
jgi:hypothetical protein